MYQVSWTLTLGDYQDVDVQYTFEQGILHLQQLVSMVKLADHVAVVVVGVVVVVMA
jgi:hypothetical protein